MTSCVFLGHLSLRYIKRLLKTYKTHRIQAWELNSTMGMIYEAKERYQKDIPATHSNYCIE